MEPTMDPITMFERAATEAAALARTVPPDRMTAPTPCSEWDVAALLAHMAGGPAYLMAALGASEASATWPAAASVDACLDGLRADGALDGRCMSPAGFEWSVAEAAAGTAMDQLIHTWDLAVAIGADRTVDPEVAAAIVADVPAADAGDRPPGGLRRTGGRRGRGCVAPGCAARGDGP